jgi:hypothetical protein
MAFTITNPIAGMLPIANFDSGVTQPNASSATPSPPLYPGMIVQGQDPTFGMGEFILLAGVASTAVGDLVIYNTVSFTTTRCPVTSSLAQPVAVAMSANIVATTWGWYQISGVAVVNKSTGLGLANNVKVAINSTAKIGTDASLKQVLGARTANSTVSATTTQRLLINRPHMQGRVT